MANALLEELIAAQTRSLTKLDRPELLGGRLSVTTVSQGRLEAFLSLQAKHKDDSLRLQHEVTVFMLRYVVVTSDAPHKRVFMTDDEAERFYETMSAEVSEYLRTMGMEAINASLPKDIRERAEERMKEAKEADGSGASGNV